VNALAAIVTASKIGINLKTTKESLRNFTGVRRRMELKGEKNGVLVIDDYGHHPTEIKATLEAIKNFYKNYGDLWCVFQPHQYSRTRFLFNDFAKAFKDANKLIINDIYNVRDSKKDIDSVSSPQLVDEIRKNMKDDVLYIGDFKKTTEYLSKTVKKNDIILTIGAGPVYKVGELFLKK